MLPLDLYLITFNCGRTHADVDAFAAKLFRPYTNELPDIVALSLQEIAPLAQAFVSAKSLNSFYAKFVDAVNQASGSRAKYYEVKRHNAGMTALIVFVKSDKMSHVGQTQVADVGVGAYEMGNKGASAIRIHYSVDEESPSTPLTFVAAHLAPGETAVQRRNKDWRDVVRGLVFESQSSGTQKQSGGEAEAEPLLDDGGIDDASSGIYNHFPMFVMGDLNYRTSNASPKSGEDANFPQPTTNVTSPKHWSHLLESDQLSKELHAGRTLHNLTEADIDFPPTYKLDIQKYGGKIPQEEPDIWHWASHRFPAWCDRILFSSYLADNAVKILAYNCMPIQPSSDHRPVVLALQLDMERARAPEAVTSYKPPFSRNTDWQSQRSAARRREIVVGVGAYLGLTWEGRGLLVATLVGVIGVSLVARSLMAV
jgi:endonuclease/exonuclease/phosphatase family metal-dependent hydrolase